MSKWQPAALPKKTASGLYLREMELKPEQLKGSQRNKPCPCGSGRKTKRCHGRA